MIEERRLFFYSIYSLQQSSLFLRLLKISHPDQFEGDWNMEIVRLITIQHKANHLNPAITGVAF